jgi:hypothetical protein
MVKPSILPVLCALLGACASTPPFTEQDAVKVAKAEVAKHGYTIPRQWQVVVVPRNVDVEFRESYPVLLVRFQRGPSERSTVFKVVVNPASNKAEDFTDMRMIEPLH